MSKEKLASGSLLVGYDFKNEENGVLLIGKKTENYDAEVINAFEGKEAYELYKKLITKNM